MNYSNFSSTLTSLFTLERHGIKLGLEHTKELLHSIGNPQDNISLIHIAGTNGKGSTSAHIESVLRIIGKKVGLYTSPHLVNFNERIRVNGVPILNKEIKQFLDKNWGKIHRIQSTFFETTTAMALDYFNKKKVDIAIIETGLGGRLDSTNVIKPKVTIITPISMDHMEILGDSIEKIAYEKAGIIKKGIPIVMSEQEESVYKIIYEVANDKSSTLIISDSPKKIIVSSSGTQFDYKSIHYKTALIGIHQAQNASVAIESLKIIDSQIKTQNINSAFGKIKWPGRLEKVSSSIFYDVAHNFSGISQMISFFKKTYPDKNLFGVFALKSDKDLDSISELIRPNFSTIYVVTDKEKLLADKFELSRKLNQNNILNKPLKSVKEGIRRLKIINAENTIGIIFGSHYIAKEVYDEFELSFDSGLI